MLHSCEFKARAGLVSLCTAQCIVLGTHFHYPTPVAMSTQSSEESASCSALLWSEAEWDKYGTCSVDKSFPVHYIQ